MRHASTFPMFTVPGSKIDVWQSYQKMIFLLSWNCHMWTTTDCCCWLIHLKINSKIYREICNGHDTVLNWSSWHLGLYEACNFVEVNGGKCPECESRCRISPLEDFSFQCLSLERYVSKCSASLKSQRNLSNSPFIVLKDCSYFTIQKGRINSCKPHRWSSWETELSYSCPVGLCFITHPPLPHHKCWCKDYFIWL